MSKIKTKKGSRGPYKKKLDKKNKPGPKPGFKKLQENRSNGMINMQFKTFVPLHIRHSTNRLFMGMKMYFEDHAEKHSGILYFGQEVLDNKFSFFTIGKVDDKMVIVFDEEYFKSESLQLRYKKESTGGKQINVGAIDYCRQIATHFDLKADKEKRIVAFFRFTKIKESIKNSFLLELVADQAKK